MFVINIAVVVNYITVDSAVCIKAEIEVICTADNIRLVLIDTESVIYYMRLAILIERNNSP